MVMKSLADRISKKKPNTCQFTLPLEFLVSPDSGMLRKFLTGKGGSSGLGQRLFDRLCELMSLLKWTVDQLTEAILQALFERQCCLPVFSWHWRADTAVLSFHAFPI
jgi:hypothetical protein